MAYFSISADCSFFVIIMNELDGREVYWSTDLVNFGEFGKIMELLWSRIVSVVAIGREMVFLEIFVI